MNQDCVLDRVKVLCPLDASLTNLQTLTAVTPFNSELKSFVKSFSRQLAQDVRARAYPEIIALAHWLRPIEIQKIEKTFLNGLPAGTVGLGRGLALHFAPGNVDTIFLYSAILSVLAGNVTVVRVSSKKSPQITLLTEILNDLLSKPRFMLAACRIRVVSYPREAAITAALSDICDLRIIWGGDQSIRDIRAFSLQPRARDVTFPDRWSLCVINSEALCVAKGDLSNIAKAFVNDSYWFGQMACSSPRIVLWHGDPNAARTASNLFWNEVSKQAERFLPSFQQVQFVDKFVAQCVAVVEDQATQIRRTQSNIVSVSGLQSLTVPSEELIHIGGGLFWEGILPDLNLLVPLLDRRSQTISSFGIDSAMWTEWIKFHNPLIDRIVPIGQALQFDTVWDGVDLFREFTRIVAVRT